MTLANGAQNISACVCQDGFWKPKNGPECLACPEYAVCVQGKLPQTLRGYWRVPWRKEVNTSKVTDEFLPPRLQCLEETACLGAIDTTGKAKDTVSPTSANSILNDTNSQGEGCAAFYNPPLCAACARGAYKEAASFRCLECYEDESNSILFMLGVVFAMLQVFGGTNIIFELGLVSTSILLVSTVSVFTLMIPKMLYHRGIFVEQVMANSTQTGTEKRSASAASGMFEASEEIAELKAELSENRATIFEQRESIAELKEQMLKAGGSEV